MSPARKPVFFTELAYLCGLLSLAFGTALMVKTDFGLSTVVAPAYLLHLKISQFLPFFSFGMAEYSLQALLLLATALLLRRFRLSYVFSFVTAILYGFTLDGMQVLLRFLPADVLPLRLVWFFAGMLFCTAGVSMLFHTYLSPEAYELVVKEVSARWGLDIHKCKTVYDCVSCAVSILLSFAFFGFWHFEGVKWGTVVCALCNGLLIRLFSRLLESAFRFRDGLPLRRFFE